MDERKMGLTIHSFVLSIKYDIGVNVDVDVWSLCDFKFLVTFSHC